MNLKSAIVICTERGPLELMSALLVKSIREKGGAFRDIPIYSVAPRKKFFLSPKKIDLLQKLGATHINLPLNSQFPFYSLANKPFACAYIEEQFDFDHLIFLDSDILVLAEPSGLFSFNGLDVLVRPVHLQHIGLSEDSDQKRYRYWNKLYTLAKKEITREVVTTIDQKRIKAYFNSGVISVKTEKKLFKKWKEIFERAMKSKVAHNGGTYFVEQSTFAVAVASLDLDFGLLDLSYNYPLNLHEDLVKTGNDTNPDSICLLHYHGLNNLIMQKTQTDPLFEERLKQSWLIDLFEEYELKSHRRHYRFHAIQKKWYERTTYLRLRFLPRIFAGSN